MDDVTKLNSKQSTEMLLYAVRQNRLRMAPLLRERNDMLCRVKPDAWGSPQISADNVKSVVPLMATYLSITLRDLVSQNPRVSVTTKIRDYKPFALTFQAVMNDLLQKMNFAATLRMLCFDALTFGGIAKTGMSMLATTDDRLDVVDEPFIDRVDPDDLAIDMTAKTWDSVSFVGNYYSVLLEDLKRSGEFENTKGLIPTQYTQYTEMGTPRSEATQSGMFNNQMNVDDRIMMLDLFLPSSQMIVTIAGGPNDKQVEVRRVRWKGPLRGPYKSLSLGLDMPNSPIGVAPASLLYNLDVAGNHMWNKTLRQGIASKRVLGVKAGGEQDAQRIQDAQDGEIVKMDNPQSGLENASIPGPDPAIFSLAISVNDLFSKYAGNLDVLGGLAPQSSTLGQDKLIASSASKMIESMAGDLNGFVAGAVRDLAFYTWNSQQRRVVVRKFKGMDFTSEFSPDTQQGDFNDYGLDIEPYSMRSRSPAEKLQILDGVMQRYVMPLLPMAQQQGIGIDVSKLLTMVADLADFDELNDILIRTEPMVAAQQADPSTKPDITTRTYRRENIPGAGSAQKQQQIAAAMSGVGQQPKESRTMGAM